MSPAKHTIYVGGILAQTCSGAAEELLLFVTILLSFELCLNRARKPLPPVLFSFDWERGASVLGCGLPSRVVTEG